MPQLRSGGATLAYTDTGAPPHRPDAPTVLFGHGLLFGGWMFRPQVTALRDRYRCLCLDWRGQGVSPAARDGYDMDTLTLDVLNLLDALGTGPVHYAGLSMGGFVGMRLAARHPDRVRSLSLLATTADGLRPRRARQFRQLAVVHRLVGLRPVRRRAAALAFGATFLDSPGSGPVLAEWERRVRQGSRTGVARAARAVADHPPVADELHGITAPTLVLVGAEDVSTPPADAERIAARIGGARLEVIAGAGHTPTLEQPGAVSRSLRDFLTEADQHP
ncbi:alpha/beta hydrolase [Streptomyces sp. LP11]|uniref:Alpha/beta hydrolase n=1 Tax=Streptomyces pyxinicus TaxID=2970331 RepID=A0ABT2B0C7_9ACTN|nr:alpha/beta hydrolase [Streptomyces sp. LP11]MCS0601398.1 alpha/beta hydrolase [Streptomyces sp. LP11]